MQKLLAYSALSASLMLVAACNEKQKVEEVPAELTTLEQKVSYIIGYDVARNTKSFEFQIDPTIVAAAIKDKQADKESRIAQEDVQAVMQEFQQVQQQKRQEIRQQQLDENSSKGKAFLEENAKKEGVTVTESGLQYKVLVEGSGEKPSAESQVKVHYKGTLLDGTEFDSSHKRGQPATFRVNQLIPGWIEALQLMQEGAKWEIYVPSDLGYGAGGTPNIPPNSALIFEMELLEILAEKTEEK